MNKKEKKEYFKDFLENNYIYNLYKDNRKKQCSRCGEWFDLLYPVGRFDVCKECVEKVEVELLMVCEDENRQDE